MLRAVLAALWISATPLAAGATADCQTLPGNLPFFYDLYTFRGEGGRTAIVAAYAIPTGDLRKKKEEGCVRYDIVVSLVLADTAVGSVTRLDDSVTVRMTRTPPRDQLLRTHLEVHAQPSASTVQRVIMSDVVEPGFGQLYEGAFPIPDYTGSQLMLSDVAISESGVEGSWRRGSVALALLPTGLLRQGFFDLYYEIYNLPAGHTYSTEITICLLYTSPSPRD